MKKAVLLLALFLLASDVFSASAKDLLIKGGKEYGRAKYGAALDTYKQAAKKDGSAAEPVYNMGAAYYKLKDYENSVKMYESSAKYEGWLKQNSYFNLGNAYFRSGKQEEAKAAYKQAILINPQDKEAIHNLQILLQNNKEDKNSENKKEEENKDPENKDSQGNSESKQDQMSQGDAKRLMQMAKEQEQKDRNRNQQKYGAAGGGVIKDW
ncbi:Tetratricopeptide TPR_2 repeat protein [Elusimicrobium minutum Pei191]|uniref:Tetratricopeptide TPR_2 repeat protein n=1 Tax=Elusimicrobium minutum (strain Pei191) TaxID=445932 RepID=B2KDS7_ELUMP|nr:tetratricopeptide repeat protein [Elusimicrobium minutum]ACC98673.1 Tetratricopeptide TPR_2 repeat protein [Elusimicrobium minutum Pei191]